MEKNLLSNGIKCDFQYEPVTTINNPALISNSIDAMLKTHKMVCDTSIASGIYYHKKTV